MKNTFQLTFILVFICFNSTVCYAIGGMEVDSNIVITNFPTRFSELIADQGWQPLSKGFIDVTKPPYSADNTGVIDCTEEIQNAINDAYDGNFVCFFPSGTYMVSDQLHCIRVNANASRKFGFQLVGSTKGTKPIIKLTDNSTAVNNKTLVFFDAVIGGVSDPTRHYCSLFRGIDIDMGRNGTVNAISMNGAQYCSIEDVKIYGVSFNAGIYNLPGSGGYTANVTIDGGNYGIFQEAYRPNPSIHGLTLTNQSISGIRLLSSRGPLVISGFKIVSPAIPAWNYNAIYAEDVSNGLNVQGSLCLTDGSIEMLSGYKIAINNIKQSITINNVYVKSLKMIYSGTPAQILTGSAVNWRKINSYIFTPKTDNGSVYEDFVKINDQTADYVLYDSLVNVSQPEPDLLSKHVWGSMPSWEDTKADGTSNIVNIVSWGATPENVNDNDDDGAIIQSCINAVTNLGGTHYGKTVFIPRGHFHIRNPLVFKSKLKIIGAGKSISVIQGLKDSIYSSTPMIQTDNDANGSLVMSDFAILPYPNLTLLNIRTNNTILRDIVTEAIPATKYVYPAVAHWLNSPCMPYFSFSDNAGGKIYGICTDQLETASFVEGATRVAGYHFIDVTSVPNPLSFYQLSVEHLNNSPQVLFDNASHVSIYGFKYEYRNELLNINNSDSIRIFGGSGNYGIDRDDDKALVVIANSKNISIQNLCFKKYIESGKTDLTTNWIVSETDTVSANNGLVLSYKIGNTTSSMSILKLKTVLDEPMFSKNGANLKIYTESNDLIIEGVTANSNVEIYNVQGVKVMAIRNAEDKIAHINVSKLTAGVFIVKVNNVVVKFINRI